MLKEQISNAMKNALKAKETTQLSAIRMLMAAIKQIEIDDKKTLTDEEIFAVLAKMIKQRQDSSNIYHDAGRDDLAKVEETEIETLKQFLPESLSPEEVDREIQETITALDAKTVKDMGKVMGVLKGKLAGRAEMSEVGRIVKELLK